MFQRVDLDSFVHIRRLTASPAESEAPGTEINSAIFRPNKKTVGKLDSIEFVYSLKAAIWQLSFRKGF